MYKEVKRAHTTGQHLILVILMLQSLREAFIAPCRSGLKLTQSQCCQARQLAHWTHSCGSDKSSSVAPQIHSTLSIAGRPSTSITYNASPDLSLGTSQACLTEEPDQIHVLCCHNRFGVPRFTMLPIWEMRNFHGRLMIPLAAQIWVLHICEPLCKQAPPQSCQAPSHLQARKINDSVISKLYALQCLLSQEVQNFRDVSSMQLHLFTLSCQQLLYLISPSDVNGGQT